MAQKITIPPDLHDAHTRCWYVGASAIAECNWRIIAALMLAAMMLGAVSGVFMRPEIEGAYQIIAPVFLPLGMVALHIGISLTRFAFVPPGKIMVCATADGLYLPVHWAPWVRPFAPAACPDLFLPWQEICYVFTSKQLRYNEVGVINLSSLQIARQKTNKYLVFDADLLGGAGVAQDIAAVANAARLGSLPDAKRQPAQLRIRPLGWFVLIASWILAGLLYVESLHMLSQPPEKLGDNYAPLWVDTSYLIAAFILLLFSRLLPGWQASSYLPNRPADE